MVYGRKINIQQKHVKHLEQYIKNSSDGVFRKRENGEVVDARESGRARRILGIRRRIRSFEGWRRSQRLVDPILPPAFRGGSVARFAVAFGAARVFCGVEKRFAVGFRLSSAIEVLFSGLRWLNKSTVICTILLLCFNAAP